MVKRFTGLLFFWLWSIAMFGDNHIDVHPIGLGKSVHVSCMLQEKNGSMWFGIDGGGLAYKESRDALCLFYNKLNGTLPTDVVLCIYQSTDGRLWFGSFGDGLFYRENGRFVSHDGLPKGIDSLQYISGIAEDGQGAMWIGTTNNGLYYWKQDGTVQRLSVDNSQLPTNTITHLSTFNGRHLYVATGWGIRVIDTQTGVIAPLTDAHGTPLLEKQLVRYLFQDNDSVLWIGSQTGLYAYHIHSKSYDLLTTKNGLADNTVRAICRDSQGFIWVTTEKSICRITPMKDKGETQHYQLLSQSVGDLVMHVRGIYCTSDGQMLFGSSGGLLSASVVSEEASSHFNWNILWIVLLIFVVAFSTGIVLYYRKRIRSRENPLSSVMDVAPTPIEIQSVDEQLIAKATALIEENMSNADFSVEELGVALGMSRSYLYKRFMAVTGMSPQKFIRSIRVKRGKQYLDQSGEGISQIAWHVGMSPKQFSKYFKEEYGVLPSDYIRCGYQMSSSSSTD